MTLTIDEEALEIVHKESGQKTHSDTVNRVLHEASRGERLRRSLEWFDENKDDLFVPGYREEFWLSRGNPEMARQAREEEAERSIHL